MTSFKLHSSAKINDTVPVNKYKSESTGLTLVLAAVEGPVVNGYFVIATEAMDDDGLPHTLEHLIFLGSEKYPYKGVLDMLANRCLASGTNAWTDTDHTCYTMTTAGKDGFLELLPIYLDHVLHPKLTDAAFITEVHHVSGDGEDAGVVYCEMQGRENTGESRSHLQLIRAVYPDNGYSSETGGILLNLRTSTTNEKIRKYHHEFYRPENLTIIIAGQVNIDEVTKSLAQFEADILSKSKREPFVKPWQTPVKPLNESKCFKVVYPSDEEDYGLVLIGWRGPKCTTENLKLTACNVLLRYLSDTSVSPLQREFIEIADPYASQISWNIVENSEALLYFSFDNCPLPKIDMVYEKLQQILHNFADGREKIDMNRLNNIIEKNILEYLSNLENNPHDTVAFIVIGDVLYGEKPEDFDMRLNVNKQLEFLQTVDETYWIDLLKQYFINGNNITVCAWPSIEEQTAIAQCETERIAKQREKLGENGLLHKSNELAKAMEINSIPAPPEMLTQVPIPSIDSIQFHPIHVYRYGDKNQLKHGLDLNALPVFGEIYDLHTNFVYMIVSLNTDKIDAKLRPYLLLFLELITESPIRNDDGTLMPYEEVVAALEKDTITLGTRLGLESNTPFTCGPYSHTAIIMSQVEQRKYHRGVKWMIDLLHNTEMIVERIRVCATKMSNSISQEKRKGHAVVRDLLKAMYYVNDSNVRASSILYQQKFLNGLVEKLNNESTANEVVADLNRLRDIITSPENMALHVAANWQQLADMYNDLNGPWMSIAKTEIKTKTPLSALPDWKKMIDMTGNDGNLSSKNIKCGTVVGLGCTESAYLYHSVAAITNFEDENLPSLLLFLQYLTQLEGPLWRQIRGQGFAYSYDAVPRPNEGLLYFTLYRCSNVIAAYKETQSIIEGQLKSDAIWDKTLFESAKSSLIFEIIQREKCIGDLVVQSLLSSFKKVPTDYNRKLIQKINEATVDDLIKVGKIYVAKLFSPEAKTAIICNPDKANDIAAAFAQMGRDLVVEMSLENSILGKC